MLPKGLKQLLVASENLFFNEVSGAAPQIFGREFENDRGRLWQPAPRQFQALGAGG